MIIVISPSGNGCAWLLVLKNTVYASTCRCFSAELHLQHPSLQS